MFIRYRIRLGLGLILDYFCCDGVRRWSYIVVRLTKVLASHSSRTKTLTATWKPDARGRAHYYNNIGAERMLADEPAAALAYFRRALREDPGFSPAWINLGLLHRRAGYSAHAEVALLHALELDRDNLMAMSNLVSLYEEAGETERLIQRVQRTPEVLKTLETSELNGVKLKEWYDCLIDAGQRLGRLVSKLDLVKNQKENIIKEFKVRQQWISMVMTLRRTVELAGWSQEHINTVLLPVQKSSHNRAMQAEKAKKDG